MCIIIYKPKGIELPNRQLLKTCWDNNPHGAGFMYPCDGRVKLKKGFMDWEMFSIALSETFNDMDVISIPLALHMRITTHGGTSQGTCHPFPLTDNLDKMRLTDTSADVGFMHNGVLAGLPTKKGKSDTMSFMKNVISPLSFLCKDFLNDKRAKRIIASTSQDCRFLLLDKSGSVRMFGKWYEDEGVFYSNAGYKQDTWSGYSNGYEGYQRPLFEDGFLGYQGGFDDDLQSLGLYKHCGECSLADYCLYYGAQCMSEKEAKERTLY